MTSGAATRLRVRAIERGDLSTFDRVRATAFGHPVRGQVRPGPTTEMDRMFLAHEPTGEPVGCVGGLSLRMTGPDGSRTPMVGIRWLGVLPDRRGQGVMRALVDHLCATAADRGEAGAVAWALAPAPYRALGFASSAPQLDLRVPHPSVASTAPPGAGLRCRLLDPAEALEALPGLYDARVLPRPGAVERTPAWWRHLVRAHDRVVGLSRGDAVVGYALVDLHGPGSPDAVEVVELVGATPAHELWLCAALTRQSPDGAVRLVRRPLDDPLPALAGDPDGVATTVRDGTVVRMFSGETPPAADRPGAPAPWQSTWF